jgi:hypothetical protein
MMRCESYGRFKTLTHICMPKSHPRHSLSLGSIANFTYTLANEIAPMPNPDLGGGTLAYGVINGDIVRVVIGGILDGITTTFPDSGMEPR